VHGGPSALASRVIAARWIRNIPVFEIFGAEPSAVDWRSIAVVTPQTTDTRSDALRKQIARVIYYICGEGVDFLSGSLASRISRDARRSGLTRANDEASGIWLAFVGRFSRRCHGWTRQRSVVRGDETRYGFLAEADRQHHPSGDPSLSCLTRTLAEQIRDVGILAVEISHLRDSGRIIESGEFVLEFVRGRLELQRGFADSVRVCPEESRSTSESGSCFRWTKVERWRCSVDSQSCFAMRRDRFAF